VKQKAIVGIIMIGIAALLLRSNTLLPLKSSLVLQFRAFAETSGNFLARLSGSEKYSREFAALALENTRLKAQLLYLSHVPRQETAGSERHLVSEIYSTYPFNHRGFISVNAGAGDGVRAHAPVTIDGFTFFGVITEVASSYSVARTIFDTGWQLPVKIGEDSVDALFVGGREPRLTLIVKSGAVADGDSVYLASRDFPYGLKIGEVKNVHGELGSAFREADIFLSYDAQALHNVYVLLP